MKLKTNGREFKDAIDSIDAPELKQAFASLARCVDTGGHDITLLADVQADAVTVSVVTGKASEALTPDAPWENPHWAVIDRERLAKKQTQAGQSA